MHALLLSGQVEDPLLERFSLTKTEDRVLLNWVTKPGTTCEGVDVMRAIDSLNYELLYHIPGICGGPDIAFSYTYLDEHPVGNRRNYYRLGLGRLGLTEVRSIEVVDLGSAGIQIRPNPMQEQAKVYFDNEAHELCKLQLSTVAGIIKGEWKTHEEFFELNRGALSPAIYLLRIQNAEGKLLGMGKLLILN